MEALIESSILCGCFSCLVLLLLSCVPLGWGVWGGGGVERVGDGWGLGVCVLLGSEASAWSCPCCGGGGCGGGLVFSCSCLAGLVGLVGVRVGLLFENCIVDASIFVDFVDRFVW